MPQVYDGQESASGAYALMRRERDSALRNMEYWKKRCREKMDKEHANGFWAGIIVTSGAWCFLTALVAIVCW